MLRLMLAASIVVFAPWGARAESAPSPGVPALGADAFRAGLLYFLEQQHGRFTRSSENARLIPPATFVDGRFRIEYADFDNFVALCADRVGDVGARAPVDDPACFEPTPERVIYFAFGGVERATILLKLVRRHFRCEEGRCSLQPMNSSIPAERLFDVKIQYRYNGGAWNPSDYTFDAF